MSLIKYNKPYSKTFGFISTPRSGRCKGKWIVKIRRSKLNDIIVILRQLLDLLDNPFGFLRSCKTIYAKINRRKETAYSYLNGNINQYILPRFYKEIELPYVRTFFCSRQYACSICDRMYNINKYRTENVKQLKSFLSIYTFKNISLTLTSGIFKDYHYEEDSTIIHYDISNILEKIGTTTELTLKLPEVTIFHEAFEYLQSIKKLNLCVPGSYPNNFYGGSTLRSNDFGYLVNLEELVLMPFYRHYFDSDVIEVGLRYCVNLQKLKIKQWDISFFTLSKLTKLTELVLIDGIISEVCLKESDDYDWQGPVEVNDNIEDYEDNLTLKVLTVSQTDNKILSKFINLEEINIVTGQYLNKLFDNVLFMQKTNNLHKLKKIICNDVDILGYIENFIAEHQIKVELIGNYDKADEDLYF